MNPKKTHFVSTRVRASLQIGAKKCLKVCALTTSDPPPQWRLEELSIPLDWMIVHRKTTHQYFVVPFRDVPVEYPAFIPVGEGYLE